jgi:hypothetical protein
MAPRVTRFTFDAREMRRAGALASRPLEDGAFLLLLPFFGIVQ